MYLLYHMFRLSMIDYTVKHVQIGHSKKDQKCFFKTDYRLMQVKSIAECSKGSILQYFRPSLSYQLSLRPLFCLLVLSSRFTQDLLYVLNVLCGCMLSAFEQKLTQNNPWTSVNDEELSE